MPTCRACRRPIQAETAAQLQGYGPDCAAKRGITPPARVRASTPGDGQTALDLDQEEPVPTVIPDPILTYDVTSTFDDDANAIRWTFHVYAGGALLWARDYSDSVDLPDDGPVDYAEDEADVSENGLTDFGVWFVAKLNPEMAG